MQVLQSSKEAYACTIFCEDTEVQGGRASCSVALRKEGAPQSWESHPAPAERAPQSFLVPMKTLDEHEKIGCKFSSL